MPPNTETSAEKSCGCGNIHLQRCLFFLDSYREGGSEGELRHGAGGAGSWRTLPALVQPRKRFGFGLAFWFLFVSKLHIVSLPHLHTNCHNSPA